MPTSPRRYIRKAVATLPTGPLVGLLYRIASSRRRGAMDLDEVLAVVELFESVGVPYFLAGGWGIDALRGRPSRPHDDLDIVIDDFDRHANRAITSLASRSYAHTEVNDRPLWMQRRGELDDQDGHHVELLTIGRRALESLAEPGAPSDRTTLFAIGSLGGRPVRCLSAYAQMLFHTGFERRLRDIHDQWILRAPRANRGFE